MNNNDIPKILCDVIGDQMVFFCEHCNKYHYHGSEEGHRAAHCDSDSPYIETGYYLIHKENKK